MVAGFSLLHLPALKTREMAEATSYDHHLFLFFFAAPYHLENSYLWHLFLSKTVRGAAMCRGDVRVELEISPICCPYLD